MTRRTPRTLLLATAIAIAIAACGDSTSPDADGTDAAGETTTPAVEAIEPTEADSEPDDAETDDPANADSGDDSTSSPKGGDPALLVGTWEPIAYVRPDGVKVDLVEIPEPERAELTWEFGADGSVKAGESVGTFEVEGVTFVATNKDSGEARTFRYTVTDDQLFVINPAGDRLELRRAD